MTYPSGHHTHSLLWKQNIWPVPKEGRNRCALPGCGKGNEGVLRLLIDYLLLLRVPSTQLPNRSRQGGWTSVSRVGLQPDGVRGQISERQLVGTLIRSGSFGAKMFFEDIIPPMKVCFLIKIKCKDMSRHTSSWKQIVYPLVMHHQSNYLTNTSLFRWKWQSKVLTVCRYAWFELNKKRSG